MTGQELFECAVHICGLGSENGGMPTDVKDLQARALPLINLVLAENSILDCRIRKCEHKILTLRNLSDEMVCSEPVARTVLPYGLAMLFMLGEDDALAAEFGRLYARNQETARSFGAARVTSIREVYK